MSQEHMDVRCDPASSDFVPCKTLDSGYVLRTFRNDAKMNAHEKDLNKWIPY
jgi:hypothetical protein